MKFKVCPDGVVLGSYALLVIIGWLMPNNIFELNPSLRSFSDAMASIIPQIDRVTSLGGVNSGNANRALYSLLWAIGIGLGAIYLVLVVRKALHGRGLEWQGTKPGWRGLLYTVVAIYLVWWEGLYMTSLHPGLRLVEFSLINRFWAGIWAPLLSIGVAIIFAGGIALLSLFALRVVYILKGVGDAWRS